MEGKILNKMLIPILLVAVCSLPLGCQTVDYRQAHIDADFGRAYETARFTQILNPDAETTLDPVTGFDGTAAINTLDTYQNGFKKTDAGSKVLNINLTK